MANERTILPVIRIPGLPLDSLGNYLASLGLLRTITRTGWPNARAAWRGGILHIVSGPPSINAVLEAVCKTKWTSYELGWKKAQRQGTKARSGYPLALWQASAAEGALELLAAHAVPADRISFNPLLGSGGNAGRRDFSKGWKKAVEEIAKAELDEARSQLRCLLLGDPVTWVVEKLNAGSWFSDANKLYNSGQRPYREGAISPWAMALACEGLAFFAGGASRRLGSRARAVGAFPFVTTAAAPTSAGEAGRDLAEIWAPVWERPMTLLEVATLFSRGRAETNGRGVLTPSAFATAIMQRGVDAGVTEFRRFVLARTTSANTFESRFDGALRVCGPTTRIQTSVSIAMRRVLNLINQFRGPLADRKKGQRWRYVGVRGGIECGMLRVTQSPSDREAACALLDSVVAALDRIDRNKAFREQRIAWAPLPLEWLSIVMGDQGSSTEARLALALVTSFPVQRPFSLYRFGVEMNGRRYVHNSVAPKRWIWRSGLPVARILSEVINRRTLDWETARDQDEPVRLVLPARTIDVDRWLSFKIDEELLARWISRLALFDWRIISGMSALAPRSRDAHWMSGPLYLLGLVQPLLDLHPVRGTDRPDLNLLPKETGARTPAAARSLVGLLRVGEIATAIRFAASRYAIAGTPIIRNDVPWNSGDAERLTASLLFPIFDHERSLLVNRWLRPQRKRGESV